MCADFPECAHTTGFPKKSHRHDTPIHNGVPNVFAGFRVSNSMRCDACPCVRVSVLSVRPCVRASACPCFRVSVMILRSGSEGKVVGGVGAIMKSSPFLSGKRRQGDPKRRAYLPSYISGQEAEVVRTGAAARNQEREVKSGRGESYQSTVSWHRVPAGALPASG